MNYSISSRASGNSVQAPPAPAAGPENDQSNSAEPLAPINFDYFHSSLMSGDSALNHFPIPGNSGGDALFPDIHPSNSYTGWGDESVTKIARSPSTKRMDENGHAGSFSTPSATMPTTGAAPPPPYLPGRPHRESLANSSQMGRPPASRAARKSIGPGALLFPSVPSRPTNFPAPRKPSTDAGRDEQVQVQPRPRNNLDPSGKLSFTDMRNLKAKSFHPQTKENPEAFLSVPLDTVRPRSSSSDMMQDPSKTVPSQRTTSSSGRRMSIIPPRATGLGARTVSPIDARRMKRMSMAAQQPPPVPRTPVQTEQPVSFSRPLSSAQSPSHLPRKSVTPSSTRATPDPSRRGLSGTPNHMRNPMHSLQQKSSQTFPPSRIPTPKPRSESANPGTGEEEEVPPVPAIPRAYGSPRDTGLDAEPPAQTVEELPSVPNRRIVRTPTSTTTAARKSLQPLKLPPLHLLPLSAPMATKIESLRDRQASELKPQTPTAQAPKTPTTPLTASKANFFSASHQDDDAPLTQVRSTTSQYINTASTPVRAFSSSSALGHIDTDDGLSLYPSDPLQRKQSSEYNHLHQYGVGDYSLKALQISRSRPQTQTSALSPNGEYSGRSLDASRDSTTGSALYATRSRDNYFKFENGGGLASADSRGLSPFKSVTPVKPTYLQPRIQEAATSLTRVDSAGMKFGSEESADKSSLRTTSSSILSPVQRIISSAKMVSAAGPRSVIPGAGADDAAADDEIKKLNSKKKDFEDSARKLDELRRKASPKERVSPAQALKIANLNIFERGEIIDFKEIYFCGTQNAKKRVGDLNAQSANFGYDDDKGDYHIVLGDHLAYRYEVLDVLGKGSFGQVMRCIDHKTGRLVAIKIIRNRKRFHQQALIEVNLLQKLKEWVGGLFSDVLFATER